MSNDLKPYENVTRVFWVKIELKENPQNGRRVFGEIKDVIGGRKSPIEDLFDITSFVIPYIEKMGVQINWFWRLANWLREKRKS